jgi:hypothetical protein
MGTPLYTNTALPLDRNGQAIQIFRPSGTRVNLTATSSSGRDAIPSGAQVVLIRATDHIWYNFGDNAVTASAANTSVLFPAGEAAVVVPTGTTHVAVLRVGSTDVPVQFEKAEG